MRYILVIFVFVVFSGCSAQGRNVQSDSAFIAEESGKDPKVINTETATEGDYTGSSSSFLSAPELVGLTNWINSDPVLSLEELRGQVVLIDFWTYACINCIRTLPHVQALYEKYQDKGFVVLGLHAPEFSYERKIENVRREVLKYGLTYPIAQDNDFATWRSYSNRYWPAHYLIDKEGNIRYTHFGEGAYQEMDRWVARLLAE